MQAHFTLMIAYAMAGSKQRTGAPATEPKGTDCTKMVEVPLDVVRRHRFRAHSTASKMPYSPALA